MDTTDLVELLRRLAKQWAQDNRASPELDVILDAYDNGGGCRIDLAAIEPDLIRRQRLRTRLSRLSHLGVIYVPEHGEIAKVHLMPRPGPSSRARIATRARDAGDSPRARDAGPQLRARGCSVLRTSSFSLSDLLSAHRARVPVRACEGDKKIWAARAERLLTMLGVEILEPYFPAWLDAVYTASEYRGGWDSLVLLVERALAQPITWDGKSGWVGWPQLMRDKGALGPMEYLTRSTFLELDKPKSRKPEDANHLTVDQVVNREAAWEKTADLYPRLRTVRAGFETRMDAEIWSIWLSVCTWSVENGVALISPPDEYHRDWIGREYLAELERSAQDAGLKLRIEGGANG